MHFVTGHLCVIKVDSFISINTGLGPFRFRRLYSAHLLVPFLEHSLCSFVKVETFRLFNKFICFKEKTTNYSYPISENTVTAK